MDPKDKDKDKEREPLQEWLPEEPVRPLERFWCGVNSRERIDELDAWDMATAHQDRHWNFR